MTRVASLLGALLLGLSAPPCLAQEAPVELDAQRVPATITHGDCLIRGGSVITVTHGVIPHADVLILHGKIAGVGPNLQAPAGTPVIDATGKFVTPGIVDAHSHVALDAVNEGSDSITAEVRIRDVIDPHSLAMYRGLTSGVTTSLLLHGSANAIGGQSVVVKMKWNRPVEELPIPDAPRMIKFALGENPKRSFRMPGAGPARFPTSRMGVEAVYRRAFAAARTYMAEWDRYQQARKTNANLVPPRRDLRLETIADILQRKIWVQCHCYRADEILMLLRLSKEFGFKIGALHHALEAYKIAPEIAAAHVGVSTFAGDWAYKLEAFDAIPYNAAACVRAGIVTSVNSDSESGSYRLNLEAAKCIRYGGLTDEQALRLITINPAIQLGIDRHVGSLDVGKDGDVAIWDGYPLSNYSKCVMTLIEGNVFFQRRDAFGVDGHSTIADARTVDRIDPLTLLPLRPSRTYAIVGGTVHTLSGPDIAHGTVVVRDGRITAVGASVHPPSDAVVVNARGLQVFPGLIALDSDLGLTEIQSIGASVDSSEQGLFQPDLLALTAVNPASELIPVTRVAGITTVETAPQVEGGGFGGGPASLVLGQGGAMELAGWTPDQMTVRDRVALHVRFPEGIDDDTLERLRQFLPPDELRRRTEEADSGKRQLEDYFERARHYDDVRTAAPDSLPVDPSLEAMRPYVTGRAPVVIAVNTAKGIRAAVQFADKYHLKLVLAGGREAWRVAKLLAEKHVPLIYRAPLSDSLGDMQLRDYDPYDAALAGAGVLARAGVKLAFAPEEAATARNLPAQVGLLCAYGLSHDEALRGMTTNPAEILGVADQVGSLDVGKRADIIVTDGDPLEITTEVHRLFIGGKPVSLQTRHTRLYQLYSQRRAEIPGSQR